MLIISCGMEKITNCVFYNVVVDVSVDTVSHDVFLVVNMFLCSLKVFCLTTTVFFISLLMAQYILYIHTVGCRKYSS